MSLSILLIVIGVLLIALTYGALHVIGVVLTIVGVGLLIASLLGAYDGRRGTLP